MFLCKASTNLYLDLQLPIYCLFTGKQHYELSLFNINIRYNILQPEMLVICNINR